MQVITAVGNGDDSLAALHLLGRLDFQAVSGRLIHVIELSGSVTRKLIAKASQGLLVAKSLKKNVGPITSIVAADHLPYGDRCLDLLLRMKPVRNSVDTRSARSGVR